MHIYCIYRYPGKFDDFTSIKVVKEGFLWKALSFSIFWAIYNKLWPIVFCMALVLIFFIGIGLFFQFEVISFLIIFFWLLVFFGDSSSDFQCWCLEKKGFKNVSLVSAPSQEIALKKYLIRENILSTHYGVTIV